MAPPAELARRRVSASDGANRPLLYVTRFVAPEQALQLITRGIPFLDTAGNAYLDAPEGTVIITGRTKAAPVVAPGSARSSTPKGMQVMYARYTARSGRAAFPDHRGGIRRRAQHGQQGR